MKSSIKLLQVFASLILFSGLLLTSCKSDKTADQQAATTSGEEGAPAPQHFKSERAAVLVGFWHYSMIVGDAKDKEKYQNRWIDIKRDDTFTSGLLDKQTNSGTWSFADETETVILHYDKKDEGLAYEWNIQGFGDMVIWKGNTASNPKATQIKMMKQKEPKFPGTAEE